MSQSRAPLRPTRVRGATMLLGDGAAAWTAVPADVSEPQYLLNDVTALSPSEAWAVGQAQDHPVVAHWDGTHWTAAPAERPPGAVGAGLLGVDVAARAAAIAVGGAFDRLAGENIPLVQHWDGARWNAVELGRGHVLTDVTMLSAAEAWAVGHGFRPGDEDLTPVALHWTPGGWARATTPPISRGRLLAVAATSPRDVWAVGAAGRSPLILHYDGRVWSRVRSPAGSRPLTDVAALTPSDAWAVDGGGVLCWNGRSWRRMDTPLLTSANTVSALAPSDVWVAGARGELAHFDGRNWSRAGSPPPLGEAAVWLGSASAAPRTVWMVGSQQTADSAPALRHTYATDRGKS
ncbi:WD40/YVTN/BNR-like repeat-containing protein [Actinomadura sp. HBU206391]|uniref:WD40/YVTN/BNR-like repeat-containing protein n=1 Tax=Actinomadura sp. HBU206391 TaxID=2731692 RepID=UPI00164F4D3B|nr:hypothetical protein [Actinomadura sp. HBU206391]MBC6456433.1 hypothetical protein [Actinomadura sp. HBU206391]